jgi:hypothetical protein
LVDGNEALGMLKQRDFERRNIRVGKRRPLLRAGDAFEQIIACEQVAGDQVKALE